MASLIEIRASLKSLPAEIEAAVARAAEGREWDAVTETTGRRLQPLIERHGVRAVAAEVATMKADPYVAAALVDLSGLGSTAEPPLRLTDFFTDDEIVDAALSFLSRFPTGGIGDGGWAWTALWNGWEQLSAADHLRLTKGLILRVPWDDQILWMIADGPLSAAASDPTLLTEIEALEQVEPNLAHMWRLVESDWPYGRPG